MNAVQAPKQPDVEADPVAIRGRPPSWETGGDNPSRCDTLQGSTGVLAVACLHKETRRNTGSLGGGVRDPQPTTREGQVGPFEVAERPV